MSGPFGSSQWMYNAGGGFYDFPISNSLRFNDAFLNFTPSPAGNRKTWTWSSWVKRSKIGATQTFIDTRAAVNATQLVHLHINGSDQLLLGNGSNDYRKTNQLFRDLSAWFHLVVAFDTTNSTANNRVRIYINGGEITSFATLNNPSQDSDAGLNQAAQHCIGTLGNGSSNRYDGYLADVCLIDGTALTPSSFGETKNDIWIPKDTSGLTFGDQGWRLQFKQSGTGTASTSTIGADTSGNDNHWTSNSLVASDVVPDSPTNNFATMNPLFRGGNNNRTISEGNLKYQATNDDIFAGNFGMSSGKHYFEIYVNDVEGTNNYFGITQETSTNFSKSVLYRSGSGQIVDDLSSAATQTSLSNAANGNIVSISVDLDGGSVQFKLNNSNVGTAVTIPSGTYFAITGNGNSSISGAKIWTFNFGQDSSFAGAATAQGNADGNGIGDFYYAPPTGFLALCTANLPDPVATIDPNKGGSPQDYFNTVLWTGNGGTQSITGVGFQPDWVWQKERSSDTIGWHNLIDSVRGVGKRLFSNVTNAESDAANNLTSFDSDGFSIGNDGDWNESDKPSVAWNWKAGTAFSNDASATSVGSIDSAGSVNTDVGFSIIGYTGTGSAGTIAHGLGAVPKMIIVKDRSATNPWVIYHHDLGIQYYSMLNDTEASLNNISNYWSDTAPSSTVFGINTSGGNNADGDSFIAYCFAEVDGYSKFGKYTGNGNADGTFVYTGFRPAFILFKRTNAASNWNLRDSKRDPHNVTGQYLLADDSGAEGTTSSNLIDFTSNGFKTRGTGSASNASGSTYIYMAFAEQPFKYSNAR